MTEFHLGSKAGHAAEVDNSKEIPRVFVGRIGIDQAVEVIEIRDIPTITRPDGSVGLTRRTLAGLALGMEEGSVLWVRRYGLTNDESNPAPTELSFVGGKVKIVLASQKVKLDGKPTHFPNLEYKLLKYMAIHAGKLVSRRELLDELWQDLPDHTRTVEIHISQLRNRLGDYSWILQTINRRGYILDDSQDPSQSID